VQPAGHVADATDCDDGTAAANPGEDEVCDSIDNDCDGTADEDSAIDAPTWFLDGDRDGYGLDGSTRVQCAAPTGYAAAGGDCDDGAAAVHPAATEVCDGVDNDCSGTVDGSDAVDASTWYADADRDSFGDPTHTRLACTQPSGYVVDDTDCDDDDDSVYVGATEVCGDGVVNDCDATAEEALAACGFGPTLDLSAADAKLRGVSGGDEAGYVVSGAGDVNGDGRADLLVGAAYQDGAASDAGAAYLVTSASSGTSSLSGAFATLRGSAAQDYAGEALAPAGDVDGDGYDDILVGTKGDDTAGSGAGVAWLLYGPVPAGTASLASLGVGLTGELAGDYAGCAVAGAGDVDGDGAPDLLIGAIGEDTGGTSAGAAYLVLGAPVAGGLSGAAQKLVGAETGGRAGWDLDGAGDLDGDGLSDLIVAAPYVDGADTDTGAVYLLLASSLPLDGSDVGLGTADAVLTGSLWDELAGSSVAGAGDVDADGYADVVIGSPGESTLGTAAGAAYLLLGLPASGPLTAADAVFEAQAAGTCTGSSVAGAGDVDGDGAADVLIGASCESTGGSEAGAAYLVLGPAAGVVALADAPLKMIGEQSTDYAGCSVAGAGDVDADGHGDLFVGAWGDDSGAPSSGSSGAAYLVLGGGY